MMIILCLFKFNLKLYLCSFLHLIILQINFNYFYFIKVFLIVFIHFIILTLHPKLHSIIFLNIFLKYYFLMSALFIPYFLSNNKVYEFKEIQLINSFFIIIEAYLNYLLSILFFEMNLFIILNFYNAIPKLIVNK